MGNRNLLLLNWRDIRNPRAGGAEVHIWEVFSRLAARGWQVKAICAGFAGGCRTESIDGIAVRRIGNEMTYPALLPIAYRQMEPSLSGRVIDFVNKLPLLTPLYVRRPLACFVHHLFGDAAHLEYRQPIPLCLKTIERTIPGIYRNVSFMVGSRSTAADLEALGVRAQAISLIEYGVDTMKYYPGKKSEVPMLLYVGRIKKYKQIHHCLQILPRLLKTMPDLKCVVAGEGDYLAQLQTLAKELEIVDRVLFLGRVDEEQKLRLYQQAWVTFFLSMKEGFGLTVGEAALCETPTIAYDVPGLRDAVLSQHTGILVAPGDLRGLEQETLALLSQNALRCSLGENTRQWYLNRSWDLTADETEKFLIRQMN